MARRKAPVIPDEVLDRLFGGADPREALTDGGLFDSLKKALAERVLNAELDHHLDAGEPDGEANGRNGYSSKTVVTGTGKLDLKIPRDRLASFDPQLIANYQRRSPGFDDKIVSMYARGMSCQASAAMRSVPTTRAVQKPSIAETVQLRRAMSVWPASPASRSSRVRRGNQCQKAQRSG